MVDPMPDRAVRLDDPPAVTMPSTATVDRSTRRASVPLGRRSDHAAAAARLRRPDCVLGSDSAS